MFLGALVPPKHAKTRPIGGQWGQCRKGFWLRGAVGGSGHPGSLPRVECSRMGEVPRQLDAEGIRAALLALANDLSASHVRGELFLVGGAALALLYNARPTTKDVDVYIARPEDAAVMRKAAARVAGALQLPDDWLNDAAKGFIHGTELGETVFSHDALTVRALAPQQLFAMKLCAWRDQVDFDDARLLLSKISGSRDEVWAKVVPFLVPGRETTACYAFQDLWENRTSPRP